MVHKTGQGEERELDRSDISYSLSFDGFFLQFLLLLILLCTPSYHEKAFAAAATRSSAQGARGR